MLLCYVCTFDSYATFDQFLRISEELYIFLH